jgi:hypothetical protein
VSAGLSTLLLVHAQMFLPSYGAAQLALIDQAPDDKVALDLLYPRARVS